MLPKPMLALMVFQTTPARLSGSPSKFSPLGLVLHQPLEVFSLAHIYLCHPALRFSNRVEPGGFAPPWDCLQSSCILVWPRPQSCQLTGKKEQSPIFSDWRARRFFSAVFEALWARLGALWTGFLRLIALPCNKKARALLEGPGLFIGVSFVRLKRAGAPFRLEREGITRQPRHRGDAQNGLAKDSGCFQAFHF
jgi:hypothetical protein